MSKEQFPQIRTSSKDNETMTLTFKWFSPLNNLFSRVLFKENNNAAIN